MEPKTFPVTFIAVEQRRTVSSLDSSNFQVPHPYRWEPRRVLQHVRETKVDTVQDDVPPGCKDTEDTDSDDGEATDVENLQMESEDGSEDLSEKFGIVE